MLARPLLLAAALALPWGTADAAEINGLRFVTLAKDHAVLRMELSEPAMAAVHWGEEPGAWAASAQATAAAESHELRMPGLSPDRRYFYQVEIDGVPAPDMSTFVSGRSWVTRRAVVLAIAAPPAGTAQDAALAERAFARESDALVLLGGPGDEASFRELHARAMADRLVVTGPGDPAPALPVADVLLAWPGADRDAAATQHGSCWTIALHPDDTPAGDGSAGGDVVLRRGESSSLTRSGETLVATLGGHDMVALAFESGHLTATLSSASGILAEQTLERTCAVPRPAAPEVDPAGAMSPDGEFEPSLNMDGDLDDGECDWP